MKILKTIKHLPFIFLLSFCLISCKWVKELISPPPPPPPPIGQGITGTVRDNNSGKEIEGAIVTIVGGNNTKPNYTTASDGKFSFPSQVIGNYTLEVAKTGYKTESVSLSVAVGQTTNKDISLKRPFEISPEAGLDFGSNEKVKKFDMKNNSDKAIGFTIKVNNPWITVEPTSGSIPPNSIFPITVTVDDKGRIPAKYDGTLSLNFDSNVDSRNYNVSMFVPNNEAPSVVCDKPTNITRTSAQVLGTITSIGKGPVTRHGHVWSENPNPTCCVPGYYTDFGARGVGQFVSSIGPLVSGKKYYVKAYAFNEKGPNPSEQEFNFTTSITATPPDVTISSIGSVTTNTAKIVSKINNDGGATISSYGVVWSKRNESTTPDPRTQKTKTEIKGTPSNPEFTSNIDGLEPNTEYYISAYAYNSTSTDPGIGKAISFNTPEPVTEPKLTTSAATDVNYTFATMKGSITDLGTIKIVEHGFVYSKSNANPTVNGKNVTYKNLGNVSMNTSLPFPISSKVEGLLKGMNYYFRTYVKTESGQLYYSPTIKTLVSNEDNLKLYYTLNGDFSDGSGNSNHGQSSAKFTTDRFENTEKSADVSTGLITEGQADKFSITGEFTISFWAKFNESNFIGGKKTIYGHGENTCPTSNNSWSGYMLYFDPSSSEGKNGDILFLIKDGSSTPLTKKKAIERNAIDTKKWQHITIIKSGNKWRVYLDSSLELSETFTFNFTTLGSDKSFIAYPWAGCNSSDGFSNLNAQIDDVRRYNKAFSDAEVLELYNREK